ncbi:hypothetical protein BDV96DRAFT_491196 [Lophiotrema nucula]|uniref:Zn(2)-C6 fungal-type domain-containing protein n=1 Tax=Lophiotrema nucula TaxID=690887 RepID=A0A6A5ZEK4_9PLEO|nr:hypothetical protein BDV96DRAFT_491196 [Lophiotrema nucula]
MHSQVTHHVPPLLFAPELAPVPTRQVAKKTLARKDKLPKVSSSYTQRAKKSKVSKRNGPMGEDDKANARLMRQMGICYRCRFYKSKCDPGLPCNNCLKTKDNARVFKLPCSRERLVDAALVRHCNGRFAQDAVRFITDYQWREGNVFDMVFMWNLPPSGDVPSNSSQLAHRPIRAGCRLYSPTQTELDTTSSPWKDITGNVRDISQAPYAIYDTANFQMQVQQYLLNIMPSLEAEVFSRVRNDDLASLTFTEAVRFRYAQHSELIDTAMKITCLSMVSQGYGNVISENIPGVRKYAESGYPHMGYTLYEAYNRSSHDRPLPTAINHQWDVAVLLLLKQLELKALKILEKKTFKGGPKAELPWYEIYLALFVLVWNMAFIKTSANRYIESKSDTALENQVRATVSRQISDWDRSFSLILMHWRGVLRDFKPFMLGRENPEELRKMGQIDETAFRYVRGTCEILARKGIDRHQPPLIAPSPTASEWIKMIFREAGADT